MKIKRLKKFKVQRTWEVCVYLWIGAQSIIIFNLKEKITFQLVITTEVLVFWI
jgi:hypothetical protein